MDSHALGSSCRYSLFNHLECANWISTLMWGPPGLATHARRMLSQVSWKSNLGQPSKWISLTIPLTSKTEHVGWLLLIQQIMPMWTYRCMLLLALHLHGAIKVLGALYSSEQYIPIVHHVLLLYKMLDLNSLILRIHSVILLSNLSVYGAVFLWLTVTFEIQFLILKFENEIEWTTADNDNEDSCSVATHMWFCCVYIEWIGTYLEIHIQAVIDWL